MARAILRKDGSGDQAPTRTDLWWVVLGLVGWAFLVAGGIDLLLAWVPPNFGNPEWEFGTVSATLDGMPLPTMGLVFLLGGAVARRRRWMVKSIGVIFGLLAVVVVGWGVLYALAAPVGLQAVPDGPVRLGLQKAIAKSVVQAVTYPVVFAWVAWKALKTSL